MSVLLPKLVIGQVPWGIRTFNGKPDLLRKLPQRLAGYAHWPTDADLRILVLVDRDDDDCIRLKEQLEAVADSQGLATRATAGGQRFQVCNRIVVEELEAWFLGDPAALCAAYPRLPPHFPSRARFRDPDAVTGGTSEALEQLLLKAGYHKGGLAKVRLAQEVAPHMNPDDNRSGSFRAMRTGLAVLLAR